MFIILNLKLDNLKALIFGSNGYIGRHLSLFFKKNNVDFSCCDIDEKSTDNHPNYKRVDIRKKTQIKKLDLNADFIFVFSGLTGTKISFSKYPDFIDINEKGLLNILECIKDKKNPARVIFPSSRLVYKGSSIPLTEPAELEAKTIYASNKIACENYLKLYSEYYNIPYTVFRINVPYGNLLSENYSYGTIGFFISQALQNKEISIYGDGLQRRTFTHIGDIVSLIIETLKYETSKNEIYNIGGEEYSIRDIANLIAEKHHVSVKQKKWPEFDLKSESGSTVFNSSKIETLTSFKYKYKIKDCINKTL